MHEVVTLQLGNRANYLATHFWNIQESYFTYPTPTDPTPEPSPVDHDIHFRPGIGSDGSDTYTPRTLVYDFQANFGGLRKLNALYETLRPHELVRGLWDGIQQTQTAPPIQPIQYQVDLESDLPNSQLHSRDVRYWSDFNRLFYHPRSILPISPQSFSSSLNAVESWSNGVDLFKDIDREVDILDRDIRPFAEESDSLSSFQIFSSVDDSWGGYASNYIEALREEYSKKGIWVWAIEDGKRVERTKQYQRLANSAKSIRAISQHASAYIRLSAIPSHLPEYIQLESSSEWSTSALLCAAIETATLPTRLRHNSQTTTASTSVFEDTLNTTGNQNIWTLKARAQTNTTTTTLSSANNGNNPTPTSQTTDPRLRPSTDADSDTDLSLSPTPFDLNYTPTLPTPQTTFPSLTTPRGHHQTHIFAQIESHRTSTPTPLSAQYSPTVQIHSTPLPFPLLTSYPSTLFNVPTRRNGELFLDAALATDSATKQEILALRDIVAGRLGRGLALIESDEVEGIYDDLTGLAGAYEFGVEGSDDEEEEDD